MSGTTTPRAHNTIQVIDMIESGKVATICMCSVVLCRMDMCSVLVWRVCVWDVPVCEVPVWELLCAAYIHGVVLHTIYNVSPMLLVVI